MEQITIKGKIEFCESKNKGYNREFTATLQDSGGFEYDNKTSVVIYFGKALNGEMYPPQLIDTRYDRTIKCNETDFKKWVQTYFEEHFSKHILTIY